MLLILIKRFPGGKMKIGEPLFPPIKVAAKYHTVCGLGAPLAQGIKVSSSGILDTFPNLKKG